jgi:hypothetical protein
MKVFLFTISLFIGFSTISLAQNKIDKKEFRKKKRKVEHKLDKSHGGLGVSLYTPTFGNKVTISEPWMEANALFDVVELKLGFGTSYVLRENNRLEEDYGTHLYAGVNYPITLLAFGRQKSAFNVMRGHPVIAGGIGYFGFTDKFTNSSKATDKQWYFGINPGYRIRLPFVSIEGNFNMKIGLSKKGEMDGYSKRFTFYPSGTLRFDALKWFFNPKMVQASGTMTSVSNIQSSSYRSGNYIYTTTTYDVTVSPIKMGVQDIGGHIGVGPKISFMNPNRDAHIPTSLLVGVAAEGRFAAADFGLTVEGGKVGHGGLLIPKSGDDHKYRKKLDKSERNGLGTLNMVNVYTQLGVDITSLILIPFGISIDKGKSTSYLGLTAGINVGAHFSWGQEFINHGDAAIYDQRLAADNGASKEKFIDPRKVGTGYLGGFFISLQVGTTSFKITNYRYYGAPFASTTMFSVAYRFPFYRANKNS